MEKKRSKIERALVRINKSFPNLDIFLLQEFKDLFHENLISEIPPIEYPIDSMQVEKHYT